MAHLIDSTRNEMESKHNFFGSRREYEYVLKHYLNEGGTQEDFDHAISRSSTIYVENLSFYTREEQIYELFEKCGEIKRVIMGLNRYKKTPCGFCFVEFYHRSDAEDCVKYCKGCKLNNRALKIAIDTGFVEGRQYGRGKDGGMKRDDYQKSLKRRGGGRGGRGGGLGGRGTSGSLRSGDRSPPSLSGGLMEDEDDGFYNKERDHYYNNMKDNREPQSGPTRRSTGSIGGVDNDISPPHPSSSYASSNTSSRNYPPNNNTTSRDGRDGSGSSGKVSPPRRYNQYRYQPYYPPPPPSHHNSYNQYGRVQPPPSSNNNNKSGPYNNYGPPPPRGGRGNDYGYYGRPSNNSYGATYGRTNNDNNSNPKPPPSNNNNMDGSGSKHNVYDYPPPSRNREYGPRNPNNY
ncbi:hypothetical protein ABK040_013955 [Willaertia magna]